MTDRIIQSWQTTATDDSNHVVKIASLSKLLSTEKKLHCLGSSGKTQWENNVALLYLMYVSCHRLICLCPVQALLNVYLLLSPVNIFVPLTMPRARALVEWLFAVDFTNCPRWFSEADFPHLCEAFCPKFLPPSVIQGILLVNLAKLSANYSIATTYYCNWMLKIHVLRVFGSTCTVITGCE